MIFHKKLFFSSLLALFFATHLVAMEAPFSSDERASGRYHAGRQPTPLQDEPAPERPESTYRRRLPEAQDRSSSPTEQRRRAEQAKSAEQKEQSSSANEGTHSQPSTEDIRQRIFVENATIHSFDTPYVVMSEQLRSDSRNPEIDADNARREGQLRGMRSAAEEQEFLKDQNNPDAIKTKEEYLKMQAVWAAQKAMRTDEILSKHKLDNLERDKAMASHDVKIALHKREELRNAVPVAKQIEEGKEEAGIKLEVQKHVKSLAIADQLSRGNLERERALASQEVYLATHKHNEARRAIPAAQQVQEGKEDATVKLEVQKHIKSLAIADQLSPENLRREEALASQEVHLSIQKRNEMRDAIPLAQQIREGKEDANVKLEVQKHVQKSLATDKLNNLQRDRTLAYNEGITNAIGSLAAKEYLRNHDYDQTLRGKFVLIAKEIAVRLAVEALADAARQGGSYCKSKLYDLYLNLPFQHCKDLKEQEEMFEAFKAMQAKQRMLVEEKANIQQTLEKDALALAHEYEGLRYFKNRLKKVQDEKEKEHLQTVIEVLQRQHDENRIKYSMLVKLNADQQPHFKRILAETQRKMKQQKAEQPSEATAQAAGA